MFRLAGAGASAGHIHEGIRGRRGDDSVGGLVGGLSVPPPSVRNVTYSSSGATRHRVLLLLRRIRRGGRGAGVGAGGGGGGRGVEQGVGQVQLQPCDLPAQAVVVEAQAVVVEGGLLEAGVAAADLYAGAVEDLLDVELELGVHFGREDGGWECCG
ncbi:hypothetical protein DFJ73DRAFT_828987 [Zopfochytrium polystomum]|nr:hypothetical protein DFJ73DRAFT_828987 [Zopfochytrium polystomum]